MGQFTCWGLLPDHHPRYGIKHSNIAQKLTRLNWKYNAIVRDGNYIYILIKSTWEDNKEINRYAVCGCPDKKGFVMEHKYLNDVIKAANIYSKIVGDYPDERSPRWRMLFGRNLGRR